MSLQSSDPVADMLTRIRNALTASKNEVVMPHSNLKARLADQMVQSGYLHKAEVVAAKPRPFLKVTIYPEGAAPSITAIKRLSKPGRRLYAGADDMPRVKSGRGVVIVSTSRGVMTGQQAKKQRLGGELICQIY
ncbi:MAG: 30S ribosomal protein S8 [Candidatus Chaera renei]|uniref:Small ribosomal subunit protein uS8 n=1 Tax=Candidatus Chaera renei TaxID=2506947 RepID=A0A4Q0AJ61_9BACT|nr:MAG: 30S ribosomal protein S8 [Candidatus Chaera renei]